MTEFVFFTITHMVCTQMQILTLTIVEDHFNVRLGCVLHQHTLGLLCVQRHFGRLGAYKVHEARGVLVLLPVLAGEVVVGVDGDATLGRGRRSVHDRETFTFVGVIGRDLMIGNRKTRI